MFRYIDYKCEECGDITQLFFDTKTEVIVDSVKCSTCGSMTYKMFGAPAVLKESLPDGTNRGKVYDELKAAAKVEKEMYNLPVEKRKDHAKEVKKLRSAKNNKGKEYVK